MRVAMLESVQCCYSISHSKTLVNQASELASRLVAPHPTCTTPENNFQLKEQMPRNRSPRKLSRTQKLKLRLEDRVATLKQRHLGIPTTVSLKSPKRKRTGKLSKSQRMRSRVNDRIATARAKYFGTPITVSFK